MNVLSESKRAAKMRPMRLSDVENGANVYDTIQCDTEPVITMDIPLSKLEALMNLEEIFFHNHESAHRRKLFEGWMSEQNRERDLRRKYDSVAKAYEHYQAMMAWCSDNRKDFKGLGD